MGDLNGMLFFVMYCRIPLKNYGFDSINFDDSARVSPSRPCKRTWFIIFEQTLALFSRNIYATLIALFEI
jgi:hypothetical protein